MTGIGGAELRMLEHRWIELDHVDVVSRDFLRHTDQFTRRVASPRSGAPCARELAARHCR